MFQKLRDQQRKMIQEENENLKVQTEELEDRVSELTKKIEIFLNQ